MKNFDWDIHLVSDEYANNEQTFRNAMCDAHTHGLGKYGSLEIQFILAYPSNAIGYLLNTVAESIQNGLKLEDGNMKKGICDDDAALKVFKTTDCYGEPIFRLVMPDGDMKYPEESNEYPYNMQYDSPYLTNIGKKNS